ncbi:DNA-binding transcriptional LysR family regulator [Rhodoblastus acidophilus]|uniref:LysR family transcriptional regulator n=1 Tax=Rhodoblastus acidophilus TaxID=1074 RepID=UPI0022247AE6|nr:LysR family transcriptional regulator [Rhodoblastus acidophilus]MCW2318673.1 DNA-binding transcriptional LysR family regulator [Rhodoblastus acidophilus]
MSRAKVNDILVFLAVARERSFTRAAAQIGVSPSALSHSLRGLEERLGVRLLTRTTRDVALTEAGERLLRNVAPHFEEIEAHIAALSDMREKPAGKIRIAASEHPASTVLWPKLDSFLHEYPDIEVEIFCDLALTNIVSERYDACVRLGEAIAKDMIAVRIGPDMRLLVVGAPSYFARHPKPETPQDLTAHNCVNIRLPTYGGVYAWEFEQDGQEQRIQVKGQVTFNTQELMKNAALAGIGLAFMPEDQVSSELAEGSLECVLEDWCPYFPGYHLYYPSRRQPSPAFALLVDALRERA